MMGTETSHTMVGQEDVGDARFDYNAVYMQWFNHWLKGEHDGVLSRPKVEYYLNNSSKWLTADSWPPPAVAHRLYLNSGIRGANSTFGDGSLQATAPKRPGRDSYLYDPAAPVPTISSFDGPTVIADQTLVAERHDVLVYTSAPLEKNLDVVGSITAKLYVSTDVKDTDLMLRLVDVFPDGRAYNVGDEALRLRYRNGFQSPELLIPGRIYSIDLKGLITATRFRPGHRIRIQITGSNFPLLERNLNTGGDNETDVKFQVADVHVYHGGARASYVTLPVLSN
jgi:putative CocE/NonD family hydrolase